MGRPSTARQRLLDSACHLMLSRGYGSIGVAQICERADVRKGSFYHFFASKQALTLEAVNGHWRDQRATWLAAMEAAPALAGLEGVVRGTVAMHRQAKEAGGAVNGCLLANLAVELSSEDRVIQERLEAIFDEQIALIQALLQRAGAEGAVLPASTGRATARAVVAQMEGMVLLAKLANDPGVLDDLWVQTLLLLRAFGEASS